MKKKYISLQEHQGILYEILYMFDDICKEHNIHYFLAYGTLIGAIRHKGIIPWDDDVDVLMEREEYDRFEKIIISNPPKGYRAYSINNTKHYYYPFIKFGKLGTHLIERDWKCVPKEGIAINIDIFPFDGCPNNRKDAEKYVVNLMDKTFKSIRFWTTIKWKEGVDPLHKLYYFIRTRPLFMKYYFKWLFKKHRKYKIHKSNYIYSFWSFCGITNLLSKNLISETIDYQFGKRYLPIPAEYDSMLKQQYGDYMTPPPENKRGSTHRNEVYIEIPED